MSTRTAAPIFSSPPSPARRFPSFSTRIKGLLRPQHSRCAGLGFVTVMMSGWGTGAFDFDNDGSKDIFIANSNVSRKYRTVLALPLPPGKQVVFKGAAEWALQQRLRRGGGGDAADSELIAERHSATSTTTDASMSLFRRSACRRRCLYNVSDAGHWLSLRLKGNESNRERSRCAGQR